MKKLTIVIIFTLCLTGIGNAQEGIEAGDREFLGQLVFFSDQDFKSPFGYINFTYGYYLSDRVVIGAGPSITIGDEVEISAQLYSRYNFSTVKKIIPYAQLSVNQTDFDPDGDFFDAMYGQVGFGAKFFVTDYLSIDAQALYGTGISAPFDVGSIYSIIGLSYIF